MSITKLTEEFVQDFYDRNASSWDNSRQAFWPGWEKLWQLIQTHEKDISVLDLGCGNGRWAQFLLNKQRSVISGTDTVLQYLGLDISAQLLAIAKANLPSLQFFQVDLTQPELIKETVGKRQFTTSCLLAVLHHIPTKQKRKQLLINAADALVPKGLLIFTTWEFLSEPSLERKVLRGKAVAELIKNQSLSLETGDYFLPWQIAGVVEQNFRFVHSFSVAEKADLIDLPGMELIAEYYSDGRNAKLNHYFVLQKQPL